MTLRPLALLVPLLLCACHGAEKALDYGDPTSLATPTEEGGITAWIISPDVRDELEEATQELIVGAYTADEPTQELRVLIGRLEKDARGFDQAVDLRPAHAEGEPGPERRFKFELPLTHGTNRLLIRIETLTGTRVRRILYALTYRGENPGVSLSVRAPTPEALLSGDVCGSNQEIQAGVTAATLVCVRGTVTTHGGAAGQVSVGLSGFERVAAVLDDEGQFRLPLSLPVNRMHVIEAQIVDDRARSTTARVEVVQDARPPSLEITSQVRETTQATLELSGKASDTYGLSAIEIESEDGTTYPLGTSSPFVTQVRLGVGDNPISVVARDIAGNETREALTLSRVRTLWLDRPTRDAGATQIEVTRFDLNELLTEEDQRSLSMVSLDLAPAIRNALEQIREPERFGVDTSSWGDAERNLQRILDMTPDTADLSGTSVEELLMVANAVGLPGPRLLAELLDIGITDYIVDLDIAAQALTELVIGTHPNVEHDPTTGAAMINISMYDVFQDMRTLAPRFGPSGMHPGFLEGESFSEVLEPGFLLSLPVSSKLVQYDAVDLSRGSKDFVFLLEGDRVLDFNVLEDEFSIVGLADEPSVDLRIRLLEHPGPGMLLAGANRSASPDAQRPGFFRGDGQAFGVSPWLFEHLTAELGYRMFFDAFAADSYHRVLRYDAGSIEDAALMDWDRGWVIIDTAADIGAEPPPLYAWDLLMEIAQVRLHDNGIPEGSANMAFSLRDLSIGLTADQLVEKLRPRLAEQEQKLSELFVGELGLADSRADFFYVPVDGQHGALLFRAPSDSEAEYRYAQPGFFSDIALLTKVSSLEPTGGVAETGHEKVPAMLGATYYASDDTGAVYEIEVAERDGLRVGLRVREVGIVQ